MASLTKKIASLHKKTASLSRKIPTNDTFLAQNRVEVKPF